MRWEEMDKGQTPLAELVKQFEAHCRLEGKPETTSSGYRHILGSYLTWAGDSCLADFTIERAREYLAYLRSRPRYLGHPTTPANGETVSPHTFRHHAVVLRIFSRWLRDEGYTADHRLERIPTPKVPETIVEVLSADEIKRLLAAEPPNTFRGSRNYSMLVLALDSGLRLSELTSLERRRLDLDQGLLTTMGKGQKERVVPFGLTTGRALGRYLHHFRPEPALPMFDNVFLRENGWPLGKDALQMLAKRLAKRTGIVRFHRRLLRHTFAVNYLINGGDAFSLQRILGHTTLEMVRRYMHLADVHIHAQHRRYSPMDVMQARLRGARSV